MALRHLDCLSICEVLTGGRWDDDVTLVEAGVCLLPQIS